MLQPLTLLRFAYEFDPEVAGPRQHAALSVVDHPRVGSESSTELNTIDEFKEKQRGAPGPI